MATPCQFLLPFSWISHHIMLNSSYSLEYFAIPMDLLLILIPFLLSKLAFPTDHFRFLYDLQQLILLKIVIKSIRRIKTVITRCLSRRSGLYQLLEFSIELLELVLTLRFAVADSLRYLSLYLADCESFDAIHV